MNNMKYILSSLFYNLLHHSFTYALQIPPPQYSAQHLIMKYVRSFKIIGFMDLSIVRNSK
jgi:hypothetical protein